MIPVFTMLRSFHWYSPELGYQPVATGYNRLTHHTHDSDLESLPVVIDATTLTTRPPSVPFELQFRRPHDNREAATPVRLVNLAAFDLVVIGFREGFADFFRHSPEFGDRLWAIADHVMHFTGTGPVSLNVRNLFFLLVSKLDGFGSPPDDLVL